MLKKMAVLAVAVGAVAALALPMSATARWKHKGLPIANDVQIGLTGQARFQGGLGGVECQVTPRARFKAGQTTGTAETFEGTVYLRSSSNPLLDMVIAFRGPAHQPIRIELAGRIDSKNGGIRNTFDLLPDAPVTKLTLQMRGGKKSLLVSSRDLCKATQRATVAMDAQNGREVDLRPVVQNGCKKKGSKGK